MKSENVAKGCLKIDKKVLENSACMNSDFFYGLS